VICSDPEPDVPKISPATVQALRDRVQQLLARRRPLLPPDPPPRYDEVFVLGTHWLDNDAD
jgi:hypothetical protein